MTPFPLAMMRGVLIPILVASASAPPCPAQRGGSPVPRGDAELVERFDRDGDGRLGREERDAARAWLVENPIQRGPGGRGGRRGGPPGRGRPGGRDGAPGEARDETGFAVDPADVPEFPDAGLYDQDVVRTVFLTFEADDWFDELVAFYRTDIEVPATMIVDGETLRDVGVGFRGNSSFFGVSGKKRSFAISVDAVHDDQRLHGYKTLNLLNGHSDPSFLRELVHARIARAITPALQANLVHLVVNGESFGIYVNVQQFNKDFLDGEFGTRKGVRWKVPANFNGAGLAYTGPDPAGYRGAYELKTDVDDEQAAYADLIELCRVLGETPEDQLERVLPEVLDVDAALRFLAVDTVLLDGDGYSSRGSDFVLWQAPDGRFRPLPYDSNEILGSGGGPRGGPPGAFPGGGLPGGGPPDGGPPDGPPGGFPPRGARPDDARDRPGRGENARRRGGPGGRRGGGPGAHASPESGPLVLLDDVDRRPLARILTVPRWRGRFLAYVRELASQGLDERALREVYGELQSRIDDIVARDPKALYGHDAFARSLDDLLGVARKRREALLAHEALAGEWPSILEVDCGAQETAAAEAATARRRVRVRVSEGVTGVTAFVAASRRRLPVAVELFDDGQHGDGEAGDGLFGGEVRAPEEGRVWVWLEAVDAGHRVALHPAGGGGRPMPLDLDGN